MFKATPQKMIYCTLGILLAISVTGCSIGVPKARFGTLPTATAGSTFLNPDKLGPHSYFPHPFEKNGIIYTCKAGHIDLTHLRWNADYTKYAARKTYNALMKKRKGFSFTIVLELSKHSITFEYPENWDDLSKEKKSRIAKEISFQTGPYIAYNATLWHEILTWFNVHFIGIEPEFHSAFSWEDLYSNLLGTKLAIEAMQDPYHGYGKAMTLGIKRELNRLGVQPKKVALEAAKKMKGKWFRGGTPVTGNLFVETLKKNMDIGIDDGFVTPTIVEGVCEGAEPEPLAAPSLDTLEKYGFTMKYEIRPREWEKDKILRVIHKDKKAKTIEPAKDYPVFIEYIKKQAIEEYGYDVE